MRKFVSKSVLAYMILLPALIFLSSCSGKDYLDTVPEKSTALMAVDVKQVFDNEISASFIKDLDGIDFSAKVYVFETTDGNIGLSAKVRDSDKFNEWLNKMAKKSLCQPTSLYNDYHFTVIRDSWVAGFSDDALVVLGPALPSQQTELRRDIIKYLEQEEEESIKGTQMFARLDSINSAISVVAQAAALPEKFIAPFCIGAPKDVDASEIMIAARLDLNEDKCLVIHGQTFSFDKETDEALNDSRKTFRPIKNKYISNLETTSVCGAFMNVEGSQFIKMLHSNKSFQALLAGINTAIDMDNIIKSIDGDVAILLDDVSQGLNGIQMAAQLGNKNFLGDIDYWKSSCPAGSKITDWEKDAYCYTANDFSYYFGVSTDMQFYSGSTAESAKAILAKASRPLPAEVQNLVTGKRLVVIVNVDALVSKDNTGFIAKIKSLTGGMKNIIYIME